MSDTIVNLVKREIEDAISLNGISAGILKIKVERSHLEYLCNSVNELKKQKSEVELLVMKNARHQKQNKSLSNRALFMSLFGVGFNTANESCRNIGLNPDSLI